MESQNLKAMIHFCIVVCLVSFLAALLPGCGVDIDPNSGWSGGGAATLDSATIDSTGGELNVTDSNSASSGVKIVVPPGALTEEHTLSIKETYSLTRPSLPNGFLPYPSSDACFELNTSGATHYDLSLQYSFPVRNMTMRPNEKAAAFAYDRRLGKWAIILPDAMDGSTMTIKASYRDLWMWGKIDLNTVETEYLVGAVKEKYGEQTWAAITVSLDEFSAELDALLQQLTCALVINLRDNVLVARKEAVRLRLLAYQAQFGGCGTCDVLSNQFRSELMTYIGDRIKILGSELWLQGAPTLSDLIIFNVTDIEEYMDNYMAVAWISAWNEIYSLNCDFACVHDKGGVGFWKDYTKYHLYDVLRLLITIAIDEGWVPCQQAVARNQMRLAAFSKTDKYLFGASRYIPLTGTRGL